MIRFEHIRKEYPDAIPLKDVNGTLEDGKVYCIIGPSGTGKTTLLRMINGLAQPTSGKIYYNDIEITDPHTDLSALRQKIGMVFQQYNLFNNMTVLENLTIPQMDILGCSKEAATQKAMELLTKVGLEKTKNKMPDQLSGGQKQRVAISRALAMDPEIILFDEPTSALDPHMTNEIRDIILDLKDGKRTIIIVTHDMQLAEEVSDEVLFMADGGICERGTPEQIFHHPQDPRTYIFIEQLKTLSFIVENGKIDFAAINKTINDYCSQLGLDYVLFNNISSVCEEMITVLTDNNKPRKISFAVVFEPHEKIMYYKIEYSGNRFNPLDEDSISSRIIKLLLSDIRYQYYDDRNMSNVIECSSKKK